MRVVLLFRYIYTSNNIAIVLCTLPAPSVHLASFSFNNSIIYLKHFERFQNGFTLTKRPYRDALRHITGVSFGNNRSQFSSNPR